MAEPNPETERPDNAERPDEERAGSERMCIVTRQVRPVDALIRFVVDPDGKVVPDLSRKLPGRGVWVSAEAGCLDQVEKKRLFAKAFGADVRLEPGLAERMTALVATRALGAIGLARKAGAAVFGFAKVAGAISSGKVVALLHAQEAAPDGMRKLDGLARAQEKPPQVFKLLKSGQLSLALGSTNVIHAALLSARPGETAFQRIAALAQLTGSSLGPLTDFDPSTEHADVSAGPNTV